jgi:hypothetical protein
MNEYVLVKKRMNTCHLSTVSDNYTQRTTFSGTQSEISVPVYIYRYLQCHHGTDMLPLPLGLLDATVARKKWKAFLFIVKFLVKNRQVRHNGGGKRPLLSIFIQKKILCHVHKTLRFHFSFGMI